VSFEGKLIRPHLHNTSDPGGRLLNSVTECEGSLLWAEPDLLCAVENSMLTD
jgi:hypothetical protein